MDSPVFLKRKIPKTLGFHLLEPESIVFFDISPLKSIKVQSHKAKQSLIYMETAFKKYNHAFNSSNKHITQQLTRQYAYLSRIHEQILLIAHMNFGLNDEVIISLGELMVQKQRKKKQKAVVKNREIENRLGEEEENVINSKMSPTYVRMNFLPMHSREHDFYRTSSSLMTSNDTFDKIREERKNRLYGSSRVTSRKAMGMNSTHTNFAKPQPLSESTSLNNSKLTWNWGIKQKCKQFSTHTDNTKHLQTKSFQRVIKLINNGYIAKDIFSKDMSFKKKRKYNNTKSKNIYNGKNTDIMVMQIL